MIALVLVNWYTCVLQTNNNGFLSLVLFLTGRLFVLIMWKEG